MADKPNQLVLEALSRAVANPEGMPLYASKSAAGLFNGSAPARQAAQTCKEQGFLKTVRTENKGKSTQEFCAITEKGLTYLLNQLSPREVLGAFVKALDDRQAQVGELLASAGAIQASLDGLKASAEKVLHEIKERRLSPVPCEKPVTASNGADTWLPAVLGFLARWQDSGSLEDCPLPELYRVARQTATALTIGQFHDGLRRLHEREQVYLHPWTGPLYEIPEPAFALLVGHEIAYYASLRQ